MKGHQGPRARHSYSRGRGAEQPWCWAWRNQSSSAGNFPTLVAFPSEEPWRDVGGGAGGW